MASDAGIQRKVLLDALRQGAVSSIAAREDLGILHPAARVLELWQRGHSIHLDWRMTEDVWGRRHRVGVYLLEVAA